MRFSLRSATPEDKDFLWSLHRETMRNYVERTWSWEESWQRRRFLERFDPTDRQIIEVDGAAVGMLQAVRRADFIHLKNIQILPSHQRRGIDSKLLKSVIEEADMRGIPVRLQVLKVNPACRLYERSGFKKMEVSSTHIHMDYMPEPGPD